MSASSKMSANSRMMQLSRELTSKDGDTKMMLMVIVTAVTSEIPRSGPQGLKKNDSHVAQRLKFPGRESDTEEDDPELEQPPSKQPRSTRLADQKKKRKRKGSG